MSIIIILLGLSSFYNEIVLTSGEYQLQVTLYSFSNPDGRCAGVDCLCSNGTCSGCCNSPSCSTRTCYYFFSICLRDGGSQVSYDHSELKGNCNPLNSTPILDPILNGDNFTDTVYGLTNPITFTGSEPSFQDGAQVYIEIINSYGTNQLIDRFAISVAPSTSTPKSELYQGIFGYAEIEASIWLNIDEANTISVATGEKDSGKGSYIITIAIVVGILLLLVLMLVTIISIVMIVMQRVKRHKRTIKDLHMAEIFHSNSEQEGRGLQTHYISSASLNLEERTYNQALKKTSIKSRMGSKSNGYERSSHTPREEVQTSETLVEYQPVLVDTDRNSAIVPDANGYESSHDLDGGENGSDPSTNESQRRSNQNCRGDYCFAIEEDDEYDYSIPFFVPSNEERELVSQMKNLRMPNITKEDLQEYEVLGSGAFGTVTRGVWKHCKMDSNEVKEEEEVAVKSIEDGSSEEERVKFLQEAAIMGQFNHPDIIKIFGVQISENECKIIMELMPKGSLKDFLPTIQDASDISSKLLSYSRQIASACGYLAVKGYVHRDVAARNVLISMEETCKIGDFGLSRHLNNCDENFYLSKGGKIPVKWTAPEALLYRLWSTASDVWSYGCVLYEIWSIGVKPFSGYTNAEAINMVSNGYRLPPPPGCPRIIYDMMIKCWNSDSDKRPSFCLVVSVLNQTENKILKWSGDDKEAYSDEDRRIGSTLARGNNLFLELQNTYMVK